MYVFQSHDFISSSPTSFRMDCIPIFQMQKIKLGEVKQFNGRSTNPLKHWSLGQRPTVLFSHQWLLVLLFPFSLLIS